MERRKRRPQRVSDTCPRCGYCDTCGRSNAAPFVPYIYPNVAPYLPYVPPAYPWGPFPYTITVSGTSSAAAQSSYNPSVYNITGLPFDTNPTSN